MPLLWRHKARGDVARVLAPLCRDDGRNQRHEGRIESQLATAPNHQNPMKTTEPNPEPINHAFIIDVMNWPEARNLTFAADEVEACRKSHKSAEDAGYQIGIEAFKATLAPLYDRLQGRLGKTQTGYDMAYVEGRVLSMLEAAEREVERLRAELTRIADYDGEPIWNDSRDDAADDMLSIAAKAIGREA